LLGTALWLAVTLGAAAAHRLRFEPPTFMLFILIALSGSFAIGLSPVGRRLAAGLPLALLVGVQGFRLPLELAMHRAYGEGIMPVQMSYSGYNFDIVTGSLAIVLSAAVALGYAGVGLVRLWNWLGSLLLANVLIIAVLSTPLFRAFDTEPLNTWVTQPPYVWLPAVMVPMALIGHIVVFRRLRAEKTDNRAADNRAQGIENSRTE
ncbi:MAG: hypothetical protein ACREMA_02530, partial [Longimicrobiales bacterium]